MLWYGQNATEKTCVFGLNRPLETPSDDEEIKIPSQNNAEIRKVDVRDEQLENTQREDWLLPKEPRHGARPRQTGAEHPPEMEDSVFRDLTDISAV